MATLQVVCDTMLTIATTFSGLKKSLKKKNF